MKLYNLYNEEVLGSFDGILSDIQTGRNIKNGTLIYTRFHEDTHRIFQASTEIGWILYLLKRDIQNAAENKDYKYCNRVIAFMNVLEDFTENISEIFANTCELLAVYENGLDVDLYIKSHKKGKYEKFCFLFEFVKNLEGTYYDKIGKVLDASIKAMQKYSIDYVGVGLEDGVAQLKEKLKAEELPELTMQRILYGELQYEKVDIVVNDVLKGLQERGTLVYIQDFVSIVTTSWFDKMVDLVVKDKDFLNFGFHKNTIYFSWSNIKRIETQIEDFISKEADLLVVDGTHSDAYFAFKYSAGDNIIGSICEYEDIDKIISNAKYIMYHEKSEKRLVNRLNEQNGVVILEYLDEIEDYFKKVCILNQDAEFISISDSKDYAVTFCNLKSKERANKIYFSILNGMYNHILYQLVEALGGSTFYTDKMMNFFNSRDEMLGCTLALLFCLEATV